MAISATYQSLEYRPSLSKGFVISVRLQIVVAIVLVLALATKVWVKVETVRLGYALADARTQAVEDDMLRRELELELSVLTRPDNLERMARQRLGFEILNPAMARKIRH